MRAFLSEHCTCGADPAAARGPLFVEGAAMLRALAEDAARIEGVGVVVTWAAGLEPFGVPGVEVADVETRRAAGEAFSRLLWETDRTLHVAPEEALSAAAEEGLCAEELGEYGRLWLGCEPDAIWTCGYKPSLHRAAVAAGLRRPAITEKAEPLSFPFVRKLMEGAGGGAILFRDAADLAALSPEPDFEYGDPPIVWTNWGLWFTEAYVPGRPCSVAVIGDAPLPPGEQHIKIAGSPGRLSYHGGSIPAPDVDRAAVNRLVAQVHAAVPGLRGWWGIDFVIPDEPFDGSFDPVLIEVNPRLTTSYLGYRALTDDNLAERLLFPERAFPPLRWNPGRATFTKDGRVDVTG